jgi:hypothetical protein
MEGCVRCGGKLKIIASIEEPEVIARILAHLEKAAGEDSTPGACVTVSTSAACDLRQRGFRQIVG